MKKNIRQLCNHLLRKGFTLIEILVVISIISLLAAILFPVFARARENARRASCTSNLKQIGLGIMMYSQDYDETFPPGAYTDGSGNKIIWRSLVQPYVKSTQLFQCPSLQVQLDHGIPDSYGCNYNDPTVTTVAIAGLMSWSSGFKLAAVNNASGTILIGERQNMDWPALPSTIVHNNAVTKVHFEGSNFAFADGHVKWLKFGQDVSPDNLWDNQ